MGTGLIHWLQEACGHDASDSQANYWMADVQSVQEHWIYEIRMSMKGQSFGKNIENPWT